ncbi:MAG: glycosyltransferase [Patescibacteria group bacterium]
MASKTKVGILAKVFVEWSGGVDFITYIANALAQNDDLEMHFLVPDSNEPIHMYEHTTPKKWRRHINKLSVPKPLELKNPSNPSLDKLAENIKVVYYRNTPDGLLGTIDKLGLDVVLPVTETLGKDFPKPWVGYIWDFQHRHLPKYFDQAQIDGRDKSFQDMLQDAPAMLVNSSETKKDITTFFPELAKQSLVVSLPFAPSLDQAWLDQDSKSVLKKYKLTRDYFAVCNQFWLHKDHITAIKAFGKIAAKYPEVDLVCTGKMEEPRDEKHIPNIRALIKKLGLQDRVHLLGFISKDDQLQILRSSLALVQPTLYEGGPGGGAAYNAAAFGTPIIASDIPVNLEMKALDLTFFEAGSADDLAKKLEDQLGRQVTQHSDEVLQAESNKNMLELSKVLHDLIEATVVQWKKGN